MEASTSREARRAEVTPAGLDPVTAELAALLVRLDHRRTLQVGCSDPRSALRLAAVHEERGAGLHCVIARSTGEAAAIEEHTDRARGLSRHLRVAGVAPELALPRLLEEDVQCDFVVWEDPRGGEQAFLEFLYLDRLLVSAGTIAILAPQSSLLAYIDRARAYERRSVLESPTVVLRKLGSHRPASAPASALNWQQDGGGEFATTGSGGVDDGGLIRPGTGAHRPSPRDRSASREAFAELRLVDELRARLATVQRLLVDAETRAGEVARLEFECRSASQELEALREAHAQAEYWLDELKGSASWRMTAPLRWLKARKQG